MLLAFDLLPLWQHVCVSGLGCYLASTLHRELSVNYRKRQEKKREGGGEREGRTKRRGREREMGEKGETEREGGRRRERGERGRERR